MSIKDIIFKISVNSNRYNNEWKRNKLNSFQQEIIKIKQEIEQLKQNIIDSEQQFENFETQIIELINAPRTRRKPEVIKEFMQLIQEVNQYLEVFNQITQIELNNEPIPKNLKNQAREMKSHILSEWTRIDYEGTLPEPDENRVEAFITKRTKCIAPIIRSAVRNLLKNF